jgi:hypothetical protein
VLRAALGDGAYEALAAVAAASDVAVFVRHDSGDDSIGAALTTRLGASPLTSTATHEIYLLPRTPAPEPTSWGVELPVRQLSGSERADQIERTRDDDRITAWVSDGTQQGDEWLIADLGAEATVNAVVLESGGHTTGFPREIAIDVSSEGQRWQRVWHRGTAALTVTAAMRDPRNIPLALSFAPVRAHYVRVSQTGRGRDPWAVAELVIAGSAAVRPPHEPR